MSTRTPALIEPYGGRLVDLLVPAEQQAALKAHASTLPSIQLSERAVCDLELLATGAFSPLDRFMGEADYRRVLADMRLADGQLFPIPVTLPVAVGPEIAVGREIALRSAKNELLAVLAIEEVYGWDPAELARAVLGTTDPAHPLVAELPRWGAVNISGPLRVLQLPPRYDFAALRLTPAQTRAALVAAGAHDVVALHTHTPPHRGHEELLRRAAAAVDGTLLLHPVVGVTQPGDVAYDTRVRAYQALAERYFEPGQLHLALLPLAMRMAGPREALWHGLIRRNYGASHLIVGPEHASPGADSSDQPFYPSYAAQELVARYSAELGVTMLPFPELVYVPAEERYAARDDVPGHLSAAALSGTAMRQRYINTGEALPEWLVRPEVAAILAEAYPPRHRQGACIWFTGLSGAGKSTTADILTVLLREHGRQVTVLDGDVVRTHLSQGLGFGKADRDVNIRRIGWVAAEIVRHGGLVVCAAVSPYRATRDDVRAMVGADHFVEVFVDTPIEVCEDRDVKGMYAKARRGEIKDFTGVDDPYEPPLRPELTLDTVGQTPEQNARRVLAYLVDQGLVRPPHSPVPDAALAG